MTVAHELLAELERHHVAVERHGARLKLRAPAPPPADLLDRLRRHKPALLAVLPDADGTRRPVIRFRLPDHPANGWATMIGTPGQTEDELLASLQQRWPAVEVRP